MKVANKYNLSSAGMRLGLEQGVSDEILRENISTV